MSGNPMAMRLRLAVMYEGPWERLSGRLLAIDPDTTEIKHEIKPDGIRDRLAAWCDLRNHEWRNRYIAAGVDPPARWRRRPSGRTQPGGNE